MCLLVCEEQRQLLGTEEESSDRHSSEGEDEGDSEVWVINDEQLEYYRAQFCTLQPDPNSLLPGSVARQFFEKSRLPVQELRKIWYVGKQSSKVIVLHDVVQNKIEVFCLLLLFSDS